MDPTLETAPSARARCRGCGERIEKNTLRLGENLPNPYREGTTMTLWFHPRCAAYKRPTVLLDLLAIAEVPDADELRKAAAPGVEHRRLTRVDGFERAPTGRARCRSCREMIAKDGWRIPLVYYEDGRFEPSGFVHLTCSKEYFGTKDVLDRAAHFAKKIDVDDLREAADELAGA